VRTFLRLKFQLPGRLPTQFRDEELRYPDELVATVLHRFTRAGATVLDPFAGYGTTLRVAQTMGRIAYGIEADARRVAFARRDLDSPGQLIHGDARQLDRFALPSLDLVLSSPPFMERGDTVNPLANAPAPGDPYAAYLADLQRVAVQLAPLLTTEARVVLEVSNLKGPGGVTTLAWDVGRALDAVLRFEGEVIVGWDHYAYGYDHSYLLVFRRR
jgi:hypothetical protein